MLPSHPTVQSSLPSRLPERISSPPTATAPSVDARKSFDRSHHCSATKHLPPHCHPVLQEVRTWAGTVPSFHFPPAGKTQHQSQEAAAQAPWQPLAVPQPGAPERAVLTAGGRWEAGPCRPPGVPGRQGRTTCLGYPGGLRRPEGAQEREDSTEGANLPQAPRGFGALSLPDAQARGLLQVLPALQLRQQPLQDKEANTEGTMTPCLPTASGSPSSLQPHIAPRATQPHTEGVVTRRRSSLPDPSEEPALFSELNAWEQTAFHRL